MIWKDVGVCSRLSQSQALALPPHRISNARSPRQEILYAYANRGADTIHLTRTFRCFIFCELNLRDSRLEDNVRKRPFWAKDLRKCISCCLEDSIPSMSDLPTQMNESASRRQNYEIFLKVATNKRIFFEENVESANTIRNRAHTIHSVSLWECDCVSCHICYSLYWLTL